jgi:hypothetical protein
MLTLDRYTEMDDEDSRDALEETPGQDEVHTGGADPARFDTQKVQSTALYYWDLSGRAGFRKP